MNKKIAALVLFISLSTILIAQTTLAKKNFFQKDTVYNPHRAIILGTSVGVLYASSITGLYALWYRDYPSSSFHTFNDADEWQQMDKIGHVGSAYYLSRWSSNLVEWTGTNKTKAAWLGAGMGFLYQGTIEVFDGFSSQWGFSVSDIAANTAGSLLFLSQELAWKEQRIQFKFSFHQTEFSKYRPAVLGSNFQENLFKDYNGQTYWLSANIGSWLSSSSKFPKWLNIAVGYGAEGMIGAFENPLSDKGKAIPYFERYRQFYLAPDIDLTKIKTRSGLLKTVFQTFGFIKFPTPALELNTKRKLIFKPLYF